MGNIISGLWIFDDLAIDGCRVCLVMSHGCCIPGTIDSCRANRICIHTASYLSGPCSYWQSYNFSVRKGTIYTLLCSLPFALIGAFISDP